MWLSRFAIVPAVVGLLSFIIISDSVGQQLIQRVTGFYVTFSATNEALDFEFESSAIELCQHPGSNRIYLRFGVSMNSLQGADTSITEWATSSNIFQTGNSRLSGRAMVLTMPASMSEIHCRVYPFATRGIVLNVDAASSASLDVNAFSVR